MFNWNRIRARDLRAGALYESPRYRDWSAGYGEDWEEVDPRGVMDLDELRAELDDIGVQYDPEETDEYKLLTLLMDHDDRERYCPAMNTYYPLPEYRGDPEEDQLRLNKAGLSCILVALLDGGDREYVLALSGGGMDLSWDIASAYIILGYLPPAWIRLPRFAGHRMNAQTRKVLAATRRQLAVRRIWLKHDAADLAVVAEWVKNGGR